MNDSISLIIPTHDAGRPLRRAVDSAFRQLAPCDEILIVGDTRDGSLPWAESLAASYGPQVRYIPHDGGRMSWGHDQINEGIRQAQCDWIHVSDDDDVWTPDSLIAFRRAIAEYGQTAMLFRFLSYVGRLVYWLERGVYGRNRIGGHCLFQPNVAGKVGVATPEYAGDFDLVDGAVQAWGGPEVVPWVNQIVVVARP